LAWTWWMAPLRARTARTGGFAAGRAHAQHGFRVVNEEARVRLKGDFDPEARGKRGLLFPIGDGNLVPLPIEDFQEIRRPRAGDPIRRFGSRVVAGAARKGGDDGHADARGEFDRIGEDAVVGGGGAFVRMEGVSMARERADFESAVRDRGEKLVAFRAAGEEVRRLAMGIARVGSRPQFNRFTPEIRNRPQRLAQRHPTQYRRKNTDFHGADHRRRPRRAGRGENLKCRMPRIAAATACPPQASHPPSRKFHRLSRRPRSADPS